MEFELESPISHSESLSIAPPGVILQCVKLLKGQIIFHKQNELLVCEIWQVVPRQIFLIAVI